MGREEQNQTRNVLGKRKGGSGEKGRRVQGDSSDGKRGRRNCKFGDVRGGKFGGVLGKR